MCIRDSIGVHCGKVLSGVVGTKKPQFSLFGDTVRAAENAALSQPHPLPVSPVSPTSHHNTPSAYPQVNTAARMCSYSQPGRINVSPTTAEYLVGAYEMTARGERHIKGKGMMATYFLDRRLAQRDRAAAELLALPPPPAASPAATAAPAPARKAS